MNLRINILYLSCNKITHPSSKGDDLYKGKIPANISTKSDPAIERNGTAASVATAFANNVLPVPGGPTNNAP